MAKVYPNPKTSYYVYLIIPKEIKDIQQLWSQAFQESGT